MASIDLGTHATPMTHSPAGFDTQKHRAQVMKAMRKHSFLTLATTSATRIPHVAGVLYLAEDDALYLSMHHDSVKVRNILANDRVAVCIPVRSAPLFPPFAVQFQGRAEVITADDPAIQRLHQAGRLKKILAGAEVSDPQIAIVRVTPGKRMTTYGVGFSLLQIARNPPAAQRSMEW